MLAVPSALADSEAPASECATAAVAAKLTAAELAAWRGLLRSHSALVKTLDSELEHANGLALSSFEVLVRLEQSEAGRMRMCELAESVLLSRSGLTRLVDRLERDGLVVRGTCEHDARGAFAVITAAGRAELAGAHETHLAGVRRHFLNWFSEAELRTLGGFLERLTAVADAPAPAPRADADCLDPALLAAADGRR